MAVISVVKTKVPGGWVYVWNPLATGDTGELVSHPGAADMSVQLFGTFDSTTMVLQGSLQVGTIDTYATLEDVSGNAISKTAAALEAVAPAVVTFRPSLSGGTGSGLTCIVFARSTM